MDRLGAMRTPAADWCAGTVGCLPATCKEH